MKKVLKIFAVSVLLSSSTQLFVACSPIYQQKKLVDLIKTNNLNFIDFSGDLPTKEEIFQALIKANPDLKDFTIDDFTIKNFATTAVSDNTKSVIIEGVGHFSGEVTLYYKKDERIFLNDLIKTIELGAIIFAGTAPTKTELITAIKNINHIVDEKFTEADFQFTGEATATTATIEAIGDNYRGVVTLAYHQELKTSLKDIIININLGPILFEKDVPTLDELLQPIKDKNPDAKDLTVADFQFVVNPSTSQAVIEGINDYKDSVTITYQDVRKNLSEIITSTDLGAIIFANEAPTTAELLQPIKDKNPTASNLSANDFQILGEITTTDATIVGAGDYKGQVALHYQKDVREDLNNIITNPNLNFIDFSGDIPTKAELLVAIKANNQAASSLTEADFKLLNDPTATTVTISPAGEKYRGNDITLTYEKDTRTDINDYISNTSLGMITFNGTIPAKDELLAGIINTNAQAKDLEIDNFDFSGEVTATTATIIGVGTHKGQVTLTYEKDTRTDINTLINVTNLGRVYAGLNEIPQEQQVKDAVKAKNPNVDISKINVTKITNQNAEINGDNVNYKGSIKVNFSIYQFTNIYNKTGVSGKASRMVVNSKGKIYFLTPSYLYWWDPIKNTKGWISLLYEANINFFIIDNNDNIFGISNHLRKDYLYKISPDDSQKSYELEGKITDLKLNKKTNDIYVATDTTGSVYYGGNIYKFASGGSGITLLNQIDEALLSCAADNNGNIYLGTQNAENGGNLYKMAAGTKNLTKISGTQGKAVQLVTDSVGNVFCGLATTATSGGLVKVNADTTTANYIIARNFGMSANFLVVDNQDNVYVSTKFSQTEDNFYRIPKSATTGQFIKIPGNSQKIAINKKGTVYLSKTTSGNDSKLYKIMASTTTASEYKEISNAYIDDIVLDNNDSLYFASSDSSNNYIFYSDNFNS